MLRNGKITVRRSRDIFDKKSGDLEAIYFRVTAKKVLFKV